MQTESLCARITTHPRAHDAARGTEAASRIDLPDAADLIAGTAGSSNFLNALIRQEAAWLSDALIQAPETSLEHLLAPMPVDASPDAELRARKRRLSLITALADLGGVWSLSEVTGALTRFADFAVETAIAHHTAAAVTRGKFDDPGDDAGVFVLAMGKMGAFELNYSSDIDLICLFDEAAYPPTDYARIRSGFVWVVQRSVRSLAAQTADGYVFRTDLRLRPDPAVTPVCIGAGIAERYYETQGRTWERAAFIKARVAAGNQSAGREFLDTLQPFIWRRHLDFAAIEDAHDMQRRIRDHKGLTGPVTVPGHDLKLGRGGIREIEFFAQTRQLIHGGRDPDLRSRETIAALHALQNAGLVAEEITDVLCESYRDHRMLEHRIQMQEDAQTHIVPGGVEARTCLAALCDSADLAAFDATLEARLNTVHQITETLYARFGTGDSPDPLNADDLAAMGFADAEMVHGLLDGWMAGRIPATRSERARAILTRIAPDIFRALAGAANPDNAARRFDTFLSGLPGGVQILSLLEANPQLMDLLSEICAASPRLAAALSSRVAVLDAVLDRDFFEPMPDTATILQEHARALEQEEDYEARLDCLRRRDQELRFRAGVQFLRGVIDAVGLGEILSRVAEAAIAALLPHVIAHVSGRYGPTPGRGVAVIAMGKLGSREMTISSDLDLITVYDAGGQTESAGPRVLPVSTYYSRLTQALVSALSVATSAGTLYEVDMRLRPSGRKGPVAVALSGFERYQHEEAWTWEHLALTRARVVAGEPSLGADVTGILGDVRGKPRARQGLLEDVRDMRRRLAEVNVGAERRHWDVKLGPGGLLDIELCVQAGLLALGERDACAPRKGLDMLAAGGFLGAKDAGHLGDALALQGTVQQLARLSVDGPFLPEEAGEGVVAALCRVTGAADLASLDARLRAVTEDAARIVSSALEDPQA